MKIYSTSDWHLATTLSTLGFTLQCIDKTNPSRYSFEFEESLSLMKAIDNYFKGLIKLDPRLVLLNAKLLKDRMYER